VIHDAVAAALAGKGAELKRADRPYTIRITEQALRMIQETGLGQEGIDLLYTRLKDVLGKEETVAKIPRFSTLPHCALHRVVIGGRDTASIFMLVLAILPEKETVVVVEGACRRVRTL
jgi:hypothetical protein